MHRCPQSISTIAPDVRQHGRCLDVSLTPEDLAAIETAVPKGAAAGERYAAAQMAHLDSEAVHPAA